MGIHRTARSRLTSAEMHRERRASTELQDVDIRPGPSHRASMFSNERNPRHRQVLPVAVLVMVLAMLVVLGAAYGTSAFAQTTGSAARLEIQVVDVGQGSAAIYRGPCGQVGVVDVAKGGASSVRDALKAMGTSSVAWVSASHYDDDHIGGIVSLADAVPTQAVYDRGGGPEAKTSATYDAYYAWAESAPIHEAVQVGSTFTLCSGDDEVTFEVVSVGTDGTAAGDVPVTDENDRSVCLLIRFKVFRGFTCGDLSGYDQGKHRDVESAVARVVGRVDYLNVSHHGSRTSSNPEFVRRLCPSVSVISVGKNSYKHPNTLVKQRLRRCGRVYQTESRRGARLAGTTTITTDGVGSMLVSTEKSPTPTTFRLAAAAAPQPPPEPEPSDSMTWLLLVCVLYGLGAWLIQLHRVIAPRDWLLERLVDLRTRIRTEGWEGSPQLIEDLDTWQKWLDAPWFRLSISRVQAGWRHVHAVEDSHLTELSETEVDQQLRTMRVRLRAIDDEGARDLLGRIGEALGDDARPDVKSTLAPRHELLRQASVLLHNVRDSAHEDLASLLAKAVWLTLLSLSLIAGFGAVFGHEVLFLFGAAGALISRLTRVLRPDPKASDYGAAWSTLILGPAAGALTAWLGVLLVSVLAAEFDLIGHRFASVWDTPVPLLGAAFAIVFGFSERRFDRLLSAAATRIGGVLPTEHEKPDPGINGGQTRHAPHVGDKLGSGDVRGKDDP
jgi:beta-lactamase superfamily II metal-dependent hydrolase